MQSTSRKMNWKVYNKAPEQLPLGVSESCENIEIKMWLKLQSLNKKLIIICVPIYWEVTELYEKWKWMQSVTSLARLCHLLLIKAKVNLSYVALRSLGTIMVFIN